MWGALLFISDKLYNPEKEEDFYAIYERLEKYNLSKEIPETYYCDLTDEEIIDWYESNLPCINEEYIQHIKDLLAEETDESEINRYNELLASLLVPTPTIEEYYNSLEEYVVRDGKLYTTSNYIDGIFDFISLKEWTNRISKAGTKPYMLQQKDLAMVDRNFEEVSLVILDEGLIAYKRELNFSDEENKKYTQTIKELISSLNPEIYLYSFGYHF